MSVSNIVELGEDEYKGKVWFETCTTTSDKKLVCYLTIDSGEESGLAVSFEDDMDLSVVLYSIWSLSDCAAHEFSRCEPNPQRENHLSSIHKECVSFLNSDIDWDGADIWASKVEEV